MFDLSKTDYQAIIFDCDGTIADNMPLHFAAWSQALQLNGAKFELTPDMILSRAGMGLSEIVAEFNLKFDQSLIPEKIAHAKDDYFYSRLEQIEAIPEVLDVFHSHKGKIPMAVASGSRRKSVRRTLNQLGLYESFDAIVTVDDVKQGKPSPDMFLLAAERMGISPEQCIVFEDGELGIQAAEACGMHWYRVKSRL